jgi:hypothetical protein
MIKIRYALPRLAAPGPALNFLQGSAGINHDIAAQSMPYTFLLMPAPGQRISNASK